jgi:DNA-binding PadR family transcriptional regulator
MKQATTVTSPEAAAAGAPRMIGLGEWVVLGVLCERPAHGWAVARTLGPSGELGAVWALSRPLVYRSIDLLKRWELIEAIGYEPGIRGPNRMVFRATTAGTDAMAQWLHEPVEHVRDVRSALLLKLVLAERAGMDQSAMLARQRRVIEEILDALETKATVAGGAEWMLVRFRAESARGVLLFLDGLLTQREHA